MGFVEWLQRRLIAHGFNPGIVDGAWGRNTRNALVAFQTANGIPASGVANEATVQLLRREIGAGGQVDAAPAADRFDRFPWMALALTKKGLHEGNDNFDLRKFLKSDGRTLGDPAALPWCGDFVETCIAVTLPEAPLPNNPYLARNWLKFGQTVDPCFGSVLVFWRGARNGTSGHVGFYYAEDASHYHVLGGNQSNRVTVSALDKRRLLGARLPNSGGPYPRLKVSASSGEVEKSDNEF